MDKNFFNQEVAFYEKHRIAVVYLSAKSSKRNFVCPRSKLIRCSALLKRKGMSLRECNTLIMSRAIEMRCFSPPESRKPDSPITVS